MYHNMYICVCVCVCVCKYVLLLLFGGLELAQLVPALLLLLVLLELRYALLVQLDVLEEARLLVGAVLAATALHFVLEASSIANENENKYN